MEKYKKIIKKIQRKYHLLLVSKLLLSFLILFILFFDIFTITINYVGKFSPAIFLFAMAIKILLVIYLIYLIYIFSRQFLILNKTADLLDRKNHDKTDTYQNALELQKEENVESEILEIIISRANEKADTQDLKIDIGLLKTFLLIFSLILLSNLFLYALNSGFINQAFVYFFTFEKPQMQHKTFVELEPGNISLKRNSNLIIKVIEPEIDLEHEIFYKIDKNWRQEKLVNFQKKFSNLDYSFDYFIKTLYAVSDTFSVKVYELPAIKDLQIHYDFPSYTGLKPETDKNASGVIKALKNTKVTLNFQANNPIEECVLIFSDSKIQQCERLGKSEFKTDFTIEKSGSYHINLLDFLKNRSQIIEKSIIAIPDRNPEIKIIYPGKDTLLTKNMLINLQIFASDDFGLQNLKLHFYLNDNPENEQMIKKNIFSNSLEYEYIFDLSNTFLLPGDRIIYWVSVEDNSPDHKIALSQRFMLRFPSIEEIYEEIEKAEEEKAEMLQNTLEKSKQMQQEFEQKRRELLKKKEVKWEDKQDMEKFIKEQEKLNNEIQQAVEDYQELIEKYHENEALSQETIEKMEKIRELMEEISNEQLKDAMQKLQEKMEKMRPEDIKEAMQNLKFSMEDFAEKLEQTIKLLEDIKKEQAMQKALEISEEMEKMQKDLNEKTKSSSGENEKLAREQENIKDKYDKLKEQLEKTKEMLDEKQDEEISKALKELMEQMKKDSLENDLSKSQENLEKSEMQKAMQKQNQASSKMQKISQSLNNMMKMMSSGAMMEMAEIIEKTIKRLLIFSFQHENSAKQYVDDPFFILPDQIANFEGIKLSLNKLYSVPMVVIVIGPKFIYDANVTIHKYQEMFQYINDAKKSKIPSYLKEIQAGINTMIYDLMQASQNSMQCQGGGMQSLMQSLQQMGEQQMMMNMLTQQLLQQMGGKDGVTQEMRNQARKIAQQEERLAENLRRMLQNDREAQKQTASMNKMIEELEEIARQIKQNRIDKNLIDKQEKILSRLLDAQKSIHKREFSKKRKSEISEQSDWLLPEEIKIKFDKMRRKALLNNKLDFYPKEYQELIKEYLRILNEKANE